MVNQAQVCNIEQINNLVYCNSNSNSDEDDEDTIFHDTIQEEVGDEFYGEVNDNDDDVHRDPINNEFLYPVDQHKGATGTMIE